MRRKNRGRRGEETFEQSEEMESEEARVGIRRDIQKKRKR